MGEQPKSLADVKGFGYPGTARGSPARVHDFELPPSFFVVGAPRCGSTSVCRSLKHHPQISFSFPKETHFLQRPRGERSLEAWRHEYVHRHHVDLAPHHALMGDGSVSYIYAPETIERALEFDARARFVMVLRDPLEMIQSYHMRLLYLLDEDVEDFSTAWELQARRAAGADLPPRCRDPRLLQYGDIGKHARHVEQVFARAGRDRCLVLLFDDLRSDERATYLQVLEFLGLDDDGQTEFRRKRRTMAFRSRSVQRLLMNPPGWVLRLIQAMAVRDMQRLKRLRRSLKKFNNHEIERSPLALETRDMLRRHFAEDVERLAQILGRDLSHWMAGNGRAEHLASPELPARATGR